MLDCPVSGTAARMKEGAWTLFVSGNAAAARRVAAVLGGLHPQRALCGRIRERDAHEVRSRITWSRSTTSRSPSRSRFARRMGLDPAQVYELFATSPVIGSGVFKLRGKFMVKRAYRPATMKIEVWQKDMQVIGDMARNVGAPTPLFSACAPIYNAAMAHGLAQHDTASVRGSAGGIGGAAGASAGNGSVPASGPGVEPGVQPRTFGSGLVHIDGNTNGRRKASFAGARGRRSSACRGAGGATRKRAEARA